MHSISLAPLYVPITILRRARLVSFWQAGPAHTLHRLSYGPDYTPEYAPYKWDGIFGILQHSHRKGCAFALTRMCQARTVTLYRRPQKYSDGSLVRGQSMMHGVPSPCQMNFEVCPDQPTHTHTHTHTTGRYLCPVYTYILYSLSNLIGQTVPSFSTLAPIICVQDFVHCLALAQLSQINHKRDDLLGIYLCISVISVCVSVCGCLQNLLEHSTNRQPFDWAARC